MRTAFVSYNSLIEPLGPTQIVPYVLGLAGEHDVTVISFEKPTGRWPRDDARDRDATTRRLQAAGVTWVQRTYHKWPSLLATLFDILTGLWTLWQTHQYQPWQLVHARGAVPGAMAWAFKKLSGVPYLYDLRGLQAQEYADAGHWSIYSLKYRLTKRMEAAILRGADGLVTLTEAIRPTVLQGLERLRPWRVIPSCVDLEHFKFSAADRAALREGLGIGDRPVLVYAGSLGTWYQLKEMFDFYEVARTRWDGLVFLLLTNGDGSLAALEQRVRGLSPRNVIIRQVPHARMPAYLSVADAGIAFITPCASKVASSPTKYAEYLACGLQIIANAGVGDVNDLIQRTGAGVLIAEHSTMEYRVWADEIRMYAQSWNRAHWRAIAEREFSLTDRAIPAYRSLYAEMAPC